MAVLLVVAYHAGLPVHGGFVGVDVFFAISGYVISELLVDGLERTARVDLRAFYARRIRRLLPALALMLTCVTTFGLLVGPIIGQRTTALTAAAAALSAANVYLSTIGTGYFDPSSTLNPLLHMWTLAVEEQFYLVFPVVLGLGWRFGRRAGALVAVGAVTVPSLAVSIALSGHGGSTGRFAFYGAPTRAWEFGLGAACALAAPSVVRVPQRVLALAAVVGLGCIDHAATATNGSAGFPGSAALWPVAGACLLLLAASGPVSRALSTRPLVAIGDVSYGWYLWHWPFIVFATALLPASGLLSPGAAVLALVPAALSYRFVEQPIRARVRAGTWTAPRLASVCVAVAVASAGLLLVTKAVLLDTDRSFSALNGTQALHADVLRGCDELNWFFQGGHRCTWAVPHARGTAVLVGDSNAGQFTEPFTQAATSLHLTAHVSTYSGCVFAELPVQPKAGSCEAYVEATVRRLVRQRPDMVVLATRADQYIADGLDARTFELGLRRALQPLSRTGVRVLLVEPIPLVPFDPARCSVVSLVANGCGASVRRAAVEVERGAALAAEGRATAGLRGVTEVDFVPALCGQAACASRLRGVDMYRDAHHLSVSGALTLTGTFARLLRPA